MAEKDTWYLHAVPDRFDGLQCQLTADSTDSQDITLYTHGTTSAEVQERIHACIEDWRTRGVRGVWIQIPRTLLEVGGVLDPILKEGFELHHAKKEYVMVNKWLPDPEEDPNPMPNYATHYVGLGGIVLNGRDELLVVSERYAFKKTHKLLWKLPGGLADPNERLSDGVEREIFEETGIRAKFEHISCFRHNPKWLFQKNDIYFVCMLSLEGDEVPEPKPDPKELVAAKWMKIDDFLSHPDAWVTNRQFVALALSRSEHSNPENTYGIREYVGSGQLGDMHYTHDFYAFGSPSLDRLPRKQLEEMPKHQSLPAFLERTDNSQTRTYCSFATEVQGACISSLSQLRKIPGTRSGRYIRIVSSGVALLAKGFSV
eukprot:gb/GECG01015911.1/.p1 GENE.gb/GECG01015911.1/~~gb/GECG01015911.1/.p1  ORF type:complete len:372 (+),score=37.78 gb/GECG01015911.1/:1-1116(+)